MNLKKHAKTRKALFLLSFVIVSSSCVTINDKTACSVSGDLSAGADCAHTNFDSTYSLDFNQFIDFLEPRPDLKKGGAICFSETDYARIKFEIDMMCRMLGSQCTYQKVVPTP